MYGSSPRCRRQSSFDARRNAGAYSRDCGSFVGLLAEGDFNAAAVAADADLGFGAMGQMRAIRTRLADMPAPMHRMGIGMRCCEPGRRRFAAGCKADFAGYQAVMSACPCHMAYRVR